MSIDRKELRRLAELAAIDIPADESELMVRQLGEILEYCRTVRREVSATEPPLPAVTPAPLREDAVRACNPPVDVASMAPEERDGYFLVPRVEGAGEP